jgi:hypothetical protein
MGNPQEEATELKNKGNEAFKTQDYATALDFYSKAIDAYDQDPSFFTNRAQVRISTVAHDHSLTSPGPSQARIIWLRRRRCGQGHPAGPKQREGTSRVRGLF